MILAAMLANLDDQRDGGTSHIAPPDMNSYIKKYEFIYRETNEFIHPYIRIKKYEFISPVT